MAAEWYFRVMGAEFGLVSTLELVQRAADGRIDPETEVRGVAVMLWVESVLPACEPELDGGEEDDE